MATITVTSTADSGTGTLRQAISDANAGDVILFDSTVFPVGQTTPIYLSSYLSVSKSLSIYGGTSLDEDGNYTSGATLTRYVKRVVNDVETEVVVTDQNPAQDDETVLFHVTNRVALDGQMVHDPNASEWEGWTGTRVFAIFNGARNVEIKGVSFRNGLTTSSMFGGLFAVYAIPATAPLTLTVEDCAFVGACRTNGGSSGLCFDNRSDAPLTFTRCEFGEFLTQTVGGVYLCPGTAIFNDCVFRDCYSQSNGGVLYAATNSMQSAPAILEVNGCVFVDNKTHMSGACANLGNDATATFRDCRFISNTAESGGSVAYSMGTAVATYEDCVFKDGVAPNGGAFFLASTSVSTFADCLFDSCSATASGGAVRVAGYAEASFDDCEFINCSATSYGGAIWSSFAARITARNTTFNDCVAGNYGGALWFQGGARNVFDDCVFESCSATSGGGVARTEGGAIGLFRNTTFKDCEANSGGAFYCISGTFNSFDAGCVFKDCVATTVPAGSAIYDNSLRWSDVESATFENCSYYSTRQKSQQQTRYFTTDAYDGDGSLRSVISAANDNDIIMPDPNVFPQGSTITIKLSNYVLFAKRLILRGAGRRIVLDGQDAYRVLYLSASTSALVAEDVDIINSGDASSNGSAIFINGSGVIDLIRSNVVGSNTDRTFYSAGSAVIRLFSCVVAGNYHTATASSNLAVIAYNSTVAGNYLNGQAATLSTYTQNINSVIPTVNSDVGFTTPPPDALAVENWNADLWKTWNLTLADNSQYKTGSEPLSETDATIAGDAANYDIEGFPRRPYKNAETEAPGGSLGAYEDRTGAKLVTTVADSGAGSLRQAIADAVAGDTIYFSVATFPKGETTAVKLTSYLTINKSIAICGGRRDANGNLTSDATKEYYVYRTISDVKTKVVIASPSDANEGETVLFSVKCRVALDGQNTTGLVYANVESTINYIGVAFNNGNRTDGGGIRTNARVTATFAECAFDSCAGTNGGALLSGNYSNLTITDCSFKSCSGTNGGALNSVNTSQNAFNGCCFDACVAGMYGGALYLYGNSVNVATNCVFYNNTSTSYAGGAIYASSTSQNTISDCLFDGCSATTSGGGVSTASNSRNTISNCEFKNGAAVNGGAIYTASNTPHTLTSCSFESCSATNSGGALYSDSSSQNVLTDCDFTSCAAKTGGALYSTSASQNSFSECSFQSNNASNGGGAVYAYSLSENTFSECSFENNTATSSGGAIIATTLAQNKLTDCDFKNNSATNGGAVITYAATQNVFTRCTFQTNTATNIGGVIAMNGVSQNAFDSCSFNDNTATNIGGAMRVMNASQVVFLGTNTISDCESPSGSGIYCESIRPIVGTPTFSNCGVEYEVNPATGQTRYFTTTADSGTGSLRAVLASCNNNDTIEPDPQTFAPGSTITIRLSSTLNATKRVHLRGSGRRIVLDGQDACPCVSCSDAAAWDMFDVAITGGYNSSNSGAAMILSSNSGAILTRCVVAGSKGYRPFYTSSAGGIVAVSSIITGTFATNAWPGCAIFSVGSTICGNYANGTHSVSNVKGPSSIKATPSTVGFISPPPDTLAAEDWTSTAWQSWNLALTAQSPYAEGATELSELDALIAGDEGRYDFEGYPRAQGIPLASAEEEDDDEESETIPGGAFGAYEKHSATTKFVSNTNDSGAGSFRQAVSDAVNGDEIVFSVATFPKGTTTAIPITSQIETSKSLRIDAEPAEVYWVVRREVNGTTSEVELDSKSDALEGEFPTKRLRCRVAIDGGNAVPCLKVNPSYANASLYLRGIAFKDGLASSEAGGGFRFTSSYDNAVLQVVDCAFIHCRRNAACGGVYVAFAKDTSSASFDNCVFLNCESGTVNSGGGFYSEVNTTANFNDCSFEGCVAGTSGSAANLSVACVATFDDCVFAYNSAQNGSLNVLGTSEVELTGCAFYANSATVSGGAIYAANSTVVTAEDCSFVKNRSTSYAGAIRVFNLATLTITNCEFDDCAAVNSNGGSVYASHSTNLTATGCSFANSSLSKCGGAIQVTGLAEATISDCSFTDLTVANGGSAIYLADTTTTTIEDCAFTRCAVTTNNGGGAIFQTNSSQATVTDSSFEDCESSYYGGAFYAQLYAACSFDGCSFTNCNSSYLGGALYTIYKTVLTVENCEFNGCYSNYGGVLCSLNVAKNSFIGCSFNNCAATTAEGGVIYLRGCVEVAFDECSFTSCSALTNGGAISVCSVALTSINDCSFTDCQAAYGGAFYLRHATKTFLTGSNSFTNCAATANSSGSAIYDSSIFLIDDLSDATFTNCNYFALRSDPTTRYFTSTADSGDGSLRSVLAASSPRDTIMPDPDVFTEGSTIRISLSSYLNIPNRIFIDGNGRHIVLDGQGACKVAHVSDALVETDVDFINGYDSTNTGAGVTLNGNPGMYLTRSLVAGVKSYRPLYATTAGGIVAIDSVITGNYATNAWPGCSIKSIGSTIEGNYVNGTATNSTSTVEAVNGIAEVLPSTVGFKAAPPDTIAAEDWNKDLWRSWNLALTPQSDYATGFDSEALDTRWEVEDESLTRDYNGYARSENGERGAFATSDVDLYWTGYDSNGDPVSEPSFESADGWATNPAERNASDRTPQSGDAVLIRGAATFDGVVEAQTVYLSGDENITLTSSDQSGINVARFQYSGTLTVAGTALFTGATDDLTLVVEGTLIVADDTTIKNLTLDDGATVSFSDAEITLTVSDDANVGEATLTCETPNARFNVPAGTDLSAATFHNVGAASDGSRVESVFGTKIGKNYAIFINTFGNNPLVSVEYKATDSSVWTVAAPAFSGTTFTIKLDGDYEFRVYDGESFHNATIKVFGLYREMCAKVQIGYLI